MKKPSVDAAYDLSGAEDARQLYADWAESYDKGFIAAQSYVLGEEVVRVFAEAGGRGPVLDVGAGTGVAATHLIARGCGPVDGCDLSAEMLEVARAKGTYRALFEADITAPFDPPHRDYAAILSSGTFTLGHVGPDGLDSLLALAVPGTFFAISINTKHYKSAGFAAKFDALAGQIEGLTLPEVPIYAETSDSPHRDDRAFVALFRKT